MDVCRRILAVMIAFGIAAPPAHAVILYSKRQRNTVAPKNELADSGWQWQGEWGSFLGTAISKSYFITAEHIGGNVGDYFEYQGRRFKTYETFDDPDSDLQIWHVQGRFASYAPLLTDYSDVNKPAMIVGRGTQRGGNISVNSDLKGWLWGANDGVQSWGMNLIKGSTQSLTDGDGEDGRRKIKGGRLYWAFDRNGIGNEAALSEGDSGGGVFVFSGNKWKLAGINFSTQAEFSYPNSNDSLRGALFDAGGLQAGGGIITDSINDIPALSYATRISTQSDWIFDVLAGRVAASQTLPSSGAGVPEPAGIAFCIFGLGWGALRRRR